MSHTPFCPDYVEKALCVRDAAFLQRIRDLVGRRRNRGERGGKNGCKSNGGCNAVGAEPKVGKFSCAKDVCEEYVARVDELVDVLSEKYKVVLQGLLANYNAKNPSQKDVDFLATVREWGDKRESWKRDMPAIKAKCGSTMADPCVVALDSAREYEVIALQYNGFLERYTGQPSKIVEIPETDASGINTSKAGGLAVGAALLLWLMTR